MKYFKASSALSSRQFFMAIPNPKLLLLFTGYTHVQLSLRLSRSGLQPVIYLQIYSVCPSLTRCWIFYRYFHLLCVIASARAPQQIVSTPWCPLNHVHLPHCWRQLLLRCCCHHCHHQRPLLLARSRNENPLNHLMNAVVCLCPGAVCLAWDVVVAQRE